MGLFLHAEFSLYRLSRSGKGLSPLCTPTRTRRLPDLAAALCCKEVNIVVRIKI